MTRRRKRKLIIDKVISISAEEMKNQLTDTTDIINFEWSPPTKKLMRWKETTGVEKLFGLPGHNMLSKTLSLGYLKHLTTRPVEDDEDDIKREQFENFEKGSSSKLNRSSNERISKNSYQLTNSHTPINVSNYSKSSLISSVVLIAHSLSEPKIETDASK